MYVLRVRLGYFYNRPSICSRIARPAPIIPAFSPRLAGTIRIFSKGIMAERLRAVSIIVGDSRGQLPITPPPRTGRVQSQVKA